MSDDDAQIPLAPYGRPPANTGADDEKLLPCRWCSDATKVSTLSLLGARCARCYAAYCREPQTTPEHPTKEQKQANPKAWATVLQRRHQRGEALTNAQVTAYRDALRPRVASGEGAEL